MKPEETVYCHFAKSTSVRGVYKISGVVCEEFDCISIEADRLEKVALVPDARYLEATLRV